MPFLQHLSERWDMAVPRHAPSAFRWTVFSPCRHGGRMGTQQRCHRSTAIVWIRLMARA